MFFRQIPCSSPLPCRFRNHFHYVGKAKKNQDREQRDQKVSHHCVLLGRAPKAPAPAVDILHEVAEVNSAGDEVGARSPHGTEQLFAALIDQRYFSQVHHISACVVPVSLFPVCLQLPNPWLRQPTLKNPSLFTAAVADRDPQHCVSSARMDRGTCRANLWPPCF